MTRFLFTKASKDNVKETELSLQRLLVEVQLYLASHFISCVITCIACMGEKVMLSYVWEGKVYAHPIVVVGPLDQTGCFDPMVNIRCRVGSGPIGACFLGVVH